MATRNDERLLGAHQKTTEEDVAFNPPPTQEKTRWFDLPVETETIEIPSKGRFYPEGHPLKDAEFVEIYHMTAKDEDILSNKDLWKKDLAIDKFLAHILVDKHINPRELLAADINAIVIASRSKSISPKYEFSLGCPSCGQRVNSSVDLDSFELAPGMPEGDEVIVKTGPKTYEIELPKTKWKAQFQLLTRDEQKKIKELTNLSVLETAVVSIENEKGEKIAKNDPRTAVFLRTALEKLPMVDSAHLTFCYSKVAPDIKRKYHFACSCGFEADSEVPLDHSFFWNK